MKKIKKIFAVVLTLSVLLSGCGSSKISSQNTQENKPEVSVNSVSQTSSDTKTSKEMKTAVIYTGMEYDYGTGIAEFEKYSYQYSGELTAEVLGEGLSEVIGLDFCFTSTSKEDGIIIDWNDKSTLLGEEIDWEKASRYFDLHFFPDGPSLSWFMMDSLWKTLTKNLGVENVYYTMNGGKELDRLCEIKKFPKDIPYMGSNFYFAHTDGKGDESDNQNISQSKIPFHVDESMLSDPPEGELNVFEAQELLDSQVVLYEGSQMLQWPNLVFIYRGIEERNGVEFYSIDLCSTEDNGESEIMRSYLVGGYGTILRMDPEYGEWDQIRNADGLNSWEMTTAVLYTNMECGSETSEFKEYSYQYSGPPSGEALAEGLSELTGLNFSVTVISKAKADSNTDGVLVFWEDDSSLIANLDDREQKEEFRFYDVDSMRWFMMDSLWKTLTENLGVENVYYTMNSDNKLAFDELYPVKEFPEDIPYMGSAFYFAHADNR